MISDIPVSGPAPFSKRKVRSQASMRYFYHPWASQRGIRCRDDRARLSAFEMSELKPCRVTST